MVQMDCSAYRGSILYGGEEYFYSAAGPENAEELSRMYASVAITQRDYKEKLNPGPNDFSKTGGMFLVHDKASILDEMATGRSLFGILQNPQGRIAAMLWVSTDDPAFHERQIGYRETLLFAREIIVRPSRLGGRRGPLAATGKLPFAAMMYYSMFLAMKGLGYTHSIGEVYKALTYSDADGEHESRLLNERSLDSIVKTGAALLEQNPARKLIAQGFNVLIEPQIVWFEYSKVLPILAKKLAGADVRMH